jgi:predicted nicotinamide N-methyase
MTNADLPTGQPRMPETPAESLGPLTRERVIVEGQIFLLERPAESDKLLDHPAVLSAFAADEFMPYWADLWPAARMLAKAILHEPWAPGTHALEIGCGLGLPGVVALSKGLRVTFSDYDATAVRFAAANAVLNGFHDFHTLQMDWRYPPENMRFPVVLASDLIYELRNVAPLVALIKRMLRADGFCLLTDQDRVPSHVLREKLSEEGMLYSTKAMRAGEPGGRRLKGTLYRITHSTFAPATVCD